MNFSSLMNVTMLEQLVERAFHWAVTSGARIFLIVLILVVLRYLLTRATQKASKVLQGKLPTPAKIKRADTVTHVIRDVGRTLIVGVGALLILSELGVHMGPLLAAAGIGGLAIGFGAQNLVKDMISGFFILLEDQVRVGDVVEIAGVGGIVEEVKLRTTWLRDLSGNVHVVPNGNIDKVKNFTYLFSFYLFDIRVAYREDVDEVMGVLHEVAEGMRADSTYGPEIMEPLEMLGVDQLADWAVVIKCRIKTQPIKQWWIGREMNRRIKKAFDERGIEIPKPHRTLYWGEPKRGTPPPLYVAKTADAP